VASASPTVMFSLQSTVVEQHASSKRASSKRASSKRTSSKRASSPRQVLPAVSQANSIQTYESHLLESQPEADIVAPTERSQAATVATAKAGGSDGHNGDGDNYDAIGWERL
jgi:hypothetical protein